MAMDWDEINYEMECAAWMSNYLDGYVCSRCRAAASPKWVETMMRELGYWLKDALCKDCAAQSDNHD
jgi:hypothetical protein